MSDMTEAPDLLQMQVGRHRRNIPANCILDMEGANRMAEHMGILLHGNELGADGGNVTMTQYLNQRGTKRISKTIR